LLNAALAQFRALEMTGWVRRAEALEARLGAISPSVCAAPESAPERAGRFQREGDVWTITWAGSTVRLRDARGFAYLALLLRHPDRELHATEIVRLTAGASGDQEARRTERELTTSADLGHAGALLDAQAHAAYRTRIADLREELGDAERRNDLGGIARYRAEIDALVQQLAAAARGRPAAAHRERARVTVSKGIKAALDRIAASHPDLGKHLTATVRRGYFCVYRPDPARVVHWDVG
jgi:non-specific serine/threonine protein kinase